MAINKPAASASISEHNGNGEKVARNILAQLSNDGRTVVPPLHRGHEQEWVTSIGCLFDVYRKVTDKVFARELNKIAVLLRKQLENNLDAARLAVSMTESMPLVEGEKELIAEILDEIGTGPSAGLADSVGKLRRELEARQKILRQQETISNDKLAELLAANRVGETITGLTPGLRLRTQLFKYGTTILAIISVPLAVTDSIGIPITSELRGYTITGSVAVAVIFGVLRLPGIYEAYKRTREISDMHKQQMVVAGVKPIHGIPRFKPNKIESRHWWQIWNERWIDWLHLIEADFVSHVSGNGHVDPEHAPVPIRPPQEGINTGTEVNSHGK